LCHLLCSRSTARTAGRPLRGNGNCVACAFASLGRRLRVPSMGRVLRTRCTRDVCSCKRIDSVPGHHLPRFVSPALLKIYGANRR
jgi:hypothetical protein